MPQKADHENDSLLSDTEEVGMWNKKGMNEMRMNEIWKMTMNEKDKPGSSTRKSVRVAEMAKEETKYQKDKF